MPALAREQCSGIGLDLLLIQQVVIMQRRPWAQCSKAVDTQLCMAQASVKIFSKKLQGITAISCFIPPVSCTLGLRSQIQGATTPCALTTTNHTLEKLAQLLASQESMCTQLCSGMESLGLPLCCLSLQLFLSLCNTGVHMGMLHGADQSLH